MRLAPLLFLPLLTLAACGDDEPAITTSTTTSTTATTAPAAATVDLGPGAVMGVHPSTPLAYVAVAVPGELGCEGGEATRLVARPITGGPDVRAGDHVGSGRLVTGGPDGRVLVVDQCEGHLTSLVSARPAENGRLLDARTEDLLPSAEGHRLTPSTIRWSADGRSFVALELDDLGQRVIAVRATPGRPAEVLSEAPGLVAVAELDDGTLVTATAEEVVLGDERVTAPVTTLTVSPDGRRVAVVGDDGVVVLEPGRAPRTVVDHRATVGSWSADGTAIAYLRLDEEGDEAAAWFVPLGGEPEEVEPDAGFVEPLFTADGEWLVGDRAVESGEGYEVPRATAWRLTS